MKGVPLSSVCGLYKGFLFLSHGREHEFFGDAPFGEFSGFWGETGDRKLRSDKNFVPTKTSFRRGFVVPDRVVVVVVVVFDPRQI